MLSGFYLQNLSHAEHQDSYQTFTRLKDIPYTHCIIVMKTVLKTRWHSSKLTHKSSDTNNKDDTATVTNIRPEVSHLRSQVPTNAHANLITPTPFTTLAIMPITTTHHWIYF